MSSAAERQFYRNRALFGLEGRTALFHSCACPRAARLKTVPGVTSAARGCGARGVGVRDCFGRCGDGQAPVSASAASGLVPSINNVNTPKVDPSKVPVGEVIQIDRLQARCTRLRKNLGVAAKWLSQSEGLRPWMLTLTYRDGTEWEPEHVREALQRLRVWLKRAYGARLRYVWVMETAARKSGAEVGRIRPHYHVVVWMPAAVSQDDLKLDDRGYWLHGLTNAVKAKAAVRYVMKYASKFDNEGAFPKGARCYGVGGLDDVGRRIRRWINWPSFVQARAAVSDCWRAAKGGGWVDRVTGEWLPSEWGLSFTTPGHTVIKRLHDHGRPMGRPGPFSWIRGCVGAL